MHGLFPPRRRTLILRCTFGPQDAFEVNFALHLHAASGWLLVRRFHRLGGRSRPSTLDSAVPFAADLDGPATSSAGKTST